MGNSRPENMARVRYKDKIIFKNGDSINDGFMRLRERALPNVFTYDGFEVLEGISVIINR